MCVWGVDVAGAGELKAEFPEECVTLDRRMDEGQACLRWHDRGHAT